MSCIANSQEFGNRCFTRRSESTSPCHLRAQRSQPERVRRRIKGKHSRVCRTLRVNIASCDQSWPPTGVTPDAGRLRTGILRFRSGSDHRDASHRKPMLRFGVDGRRRRPAHIVAPAHRNYETNQKTRDLYRVSALKSRHLAPNSIHNVAPRAYAARSGRVPV